MGGGADIKSLGRIGGAVLAGLAAGAAPGQQSEPPGADVFLEVRTGLIVSDNFEGEEDPAGTSTISQTDLTFGFDSETKTQGLSIRLGTRVEYGEVPDEVDFRQGRSDPFLTVGYQLSNKTARLNFDASYRERDNGFTTIDTLTIDEEGQIISGDDLVIDEGTRRDLNVSMGYETGVGGPVGLRVRLNWGTTTFADTLNADLNDVLRLGGEAILRTSLSRTTDLSFNTRFNFREEDDEVNTTETNWSYGLSLRSQVNPSLTLTAGLNHAVSESETTTDGETITDRNEGPTFSFGLEKAVKNGSYGAQLSSQISTTSNFTTLRFTRSLGLRTGSIEAMVGATFDDENNVFGIGRLAVTQRTKSGQLTGLLEQSVNTSDDDDDELVSRLGLSYAYTLSKVSNLALSANYTAVDDLSDDGVDQQQSTVSLSYNQALSRDWSLTTGVSHSVSRSSDRDAIIENRVFANVGRRFSLRP